MKVKFERVKRKSAQSKKLLFGIGVNDSWYKVYFKGVKCPIYLKWVNLLNRCYSDKYHKTRPTYKNCSVCEEWLTFSNFAEWMNQQDWEGKHLDKDLLKPNNREYGPETCCFINQRLNSALLGKVKDQGDYPQGVDYRPKDNKYAVRLSKYGKTVSGGYFKTPEEAGIKYLKEKAIYFKELLEEQDDERVIRGLTAHIKMLEGRVRDEDL